MARLGSAGPELDDCIRYALLVTISRWIAFVFQPEAINSTASQSSIAGLVGALPLTPKSNSVGTSGVPKCRIQMWLTATRAVSGFFRSTIHFASASRRPVLVAG